MSRIPDFYSIWWDGEVPNEPEHAVEACLALTAEETSVDEDFKDKLIAAYKVTKYFDDNGPWKKDGLVRFDDLYLYHDRVVIPRPATELRDCLVYEMHDNAGHSN